MKNCTTIRGFVQPDKSVKERPCGNRVIPFVDQQPADQCFACYSDLEEPKFDTGVKWIDRNDGGTPK